MRLSLCKCYSFPTHWSLKSSFNVGVKVRCWRPASPRGLPSWHHSHYLCVCMLLFQFSSHWAANNLKQQGYSLTTLSVESPCRPPPDLSPAREAASECVHVCAHMYACVRVCEITAASMWLEGGMCVRGFHMTYEVVYSVHHSVRLWVWVQVLRVHILHTQLCRGVGRVKAQDELHRGDKLPLTANSVL